MAKTKEDMNTIRIMRRIFSDKSTIGELFLPGEDTPFCKTLEDTVRRHKVRHKTAIPAGRYELAIGKSNRFGREMPYLKDVPYFMGIMLHWGNTDADTSGCILVGYGPASQDFMGRSRDAFDDLYPKILALMKKGPVYVDVVGGVKAEDWKPLEFGQ